MSKEPQDVDELIQSVLDGSEEIAPVDRCPVCGFSGVLVLHPYGGVVTVHEGRRFVCRVLEAERPALTSDEVLEG